MLFHGSETQFVWFSLTVHPRHARSMTAAAGLVGRVLSFATVYLYIFRIFDLDKILALSELAFCAYPREI